MATTLRTRPDFQIDRFPDGTIAAAEGTDSAGNSLTLSLERQRQGNASTANLRLLLNRSLLLLSACTLSTESELVSYQLEAGDLRLGFGADFSRYEQDHLVFVTGEATGASAGVPQQFECAYDLRTHRGTVDLSLDRLFPSAVKNDLPPFSSLLYELYFRQLNDSRPTQAEVDITIFNSRWKAAGRAACWGLGMGAASMTGILAAPIPPLAVVAGAVVFGAAPQICTEFFKDSSRTSTA